ncbi:MAG: di-heme oxidoredictase family protein [Myxococcota bacterium]
MQPTNEANKAHQEGDTRITQAMRHATWIPWLTAMLIAGCAGADPVVDDPPPPDPTPPDPSPTPPAIFAPLGEPLPTLTTEQLAAFERGRAVALRQFNKESGLGPEFNATFCAGCHEKPVIGGGASHYRDFILLGLRALDDTTFLRGKNGVQRQYSLETGRDPSDTEADVTATRNPIPFFGAGLLLEIPDSEILALEDPEDADGDGISGRANLVDGVVGRFGRKAQTTSLELFIRGPLFNHMGVTTEPLPASRRAELPMQLSDELVFGSKQSVLPDEPLPDLDETPDPELSEDELFDLVSFSMTLAAPEPDPATPLTERGSAHFVEAGCTDCHVPSLEGPRGPIPLYSDLLLHDMGPDLADQFTFGDSGPSEFRTQPLWGVVAAAPYLHDGRAATLDEAIRWHGGEAQAAADAYMASGEAAQDELLAFLGSLGGGAQASDGLLPPDAPVEPVGSYGGPVAPLSDDARASFVRGRAMFDRDFSYTDGVGPEFNGDSCRGCHFMPTIGGAGPSGVDAMRQGIVDSQSGFETPESGTAILRHATFIAPERPEPDPRSNVFEPRQTPVVFGLGLIERIPRQTIEAMADPDDDDGDGIAGRAHVLPDGRLGRFGWKANVPSVREFVRDALSNELGMTVPDEPGLSFGHSADQDDVSDPEASVELVDALESYLQLLGPPPRRLSDETVEDLGQALFATVGCASCHVPTLSTQDGELVPLYSDLLLHDVAAEGAVGIAEGDAGIRDFRTPPLWGLSETTPYMHDGRASTVEAAIEAHAGEATASRDAVRSLSDTDRASLLAFLQSL